MTKWQYETGSIFNGISLIILMSILGQLFYWSNPVNNIQNEIFSSILEFTKSYNESETNNRLLFDMNTMWQLKTYTIWDLLKNIAFILEIAGYFIVSYSLWKFKKLQEIRDQHYIILLISSCIINILASQITGFLASLLYLISSILIMGCFYQLQRSSTFPPKARQGSNKIFYSMLIYILGMVLGLLPLIGIILITLLTLISFILLILGGIEIKEAQPINKRGKEIILKEKSRGNINIITNYLFVGFFIYCLFYMVIDKYFN